MNDKRKGDRPTKQYLKSWTSEIRKKNQQTPDIDASGPSVDPSTAHWSLMENGGCEQAIRKEGKQEEKAGVCQITQDVG